MKLLAFFAKRIIKKYSVKIIGISGSVGKTSLKNTLELTLSTKFKVRSSIKNYNNEFGLPLSIIGMESPGKNILGWFKVFLRAKKLLFLKDKNYPEILILEMGIDRPGDMDYLLSIARPDIGILTNISHSHIEFFNSLEKIKEEKAKLLKGLKKDALAILNFDNKYLNSLIPELKSKTFSYGLKEGADFLAKDINIDFNGINFKLDYQGKVFPINLPGIINQSSVYSVLASLVVAHFLGLNLLDIANNFENLKALPGRMSIVSGIKGSMIIDDTYNSSPESCINALESIDKINFPGRKILIMGDMLELGKYSEEGHRLVGKKIAESKAKLLFLIGDKSKDTAKSAIKSGFKKENVFHFLKYSDAINTIKENIAQGDLILVKASQGIRLEKIVKEIMHEPDNAKNLLVRQEKNWD